jgi:hypothetical protein
MLVDHNDQLVGAIVDSFNAYVIRKVGNDWLALFAPPSGFVEGEVTFLHKSAACDDDRLLLTSFTQGLVYPAQVHSGSIFYTKTLDPNNQIAVTVLGQERFTAGQDASAPGTCEAYPYSAFPQSVGPVVTATDSALTTFVAPFKVK